MKKIMKKSSKVTVVLFTLALLFMMAGCGKKTYASVEEWYNADPKTAAIVNASLGSSMDGATVSMVIKENNITCKIEMDEAMFGQDPEVDAVYKEALDEAFSQDEDSVKSYIDEMAAETGVDASKITVTYAVHNPGESTPGYSISFTK